MEETEKGIRFRSPAPETIERLLNHDKKFDNIENMTSELNTNFKLMKKDIQTICEKLDENKEEHKAIMYKIDAFLNGCDSKYATKGFEVTVTKILWGAGFLILGAVATAIFKVIFK